MTSRRQRLWMIFAAAATTAAAVAIVLTVAGTRLLAGLLEAALSAPPQAVVRIDKLSFRGLGTLRLGGVAAADAAGTWLELPSLTIEWQPRRLFAGELHIRAVAAERLAIRRWPTGGGAGGGWPPDIAWPSLPLDLRVDKLTVAALTLPALDQRTLPPLRVQGRLRLDDARLDADVAAVGSAGDRLTLRADGKRAAETLSLDLKVVSNEKGVLSEAIRAAGLRQLADITFAIKGDGPWRAWRGVVAARLAGVAGFDGHVMVDDRARLALVGRFQAAPGLAAALDLPPWAAGLIAPPSAINLVLDIDEDGAAQALTASAINPHLTLRIASGGAVGWSAAKVDLKLAKPPLPAPTTLAALRVTGRVAWDNAITATLALSGQGLAGAEGKIGKADGSLRLDWQPKSRTLSADGSGALLDVMTSWRRQGFEKIRWSAEGRWENGRRLALDKVSINDGRLTLAGGGSYDFKAKRGTAKGRLSGDIAHLADGWRSGVAAMDATVAADGGVTRLTLAGDLTAAKGGGRLDALGPIRVVGDLALEPNLTARLFLTSPAAAFQGAYEPAAARAELVAVDGGAVGRLLGIALADGSRATLDYRQQRSATALLRLEAPWLIAADGGLRRATLAVSLDDVTHAPHGGVTLNASSPLGPLRAVGGLAVDQEKVVLSNIMVDSPVATVLGGLSLARASGLISGRLTGASGDLAVLRRSAGVDAGGALRLDLAFAPTEWKGETLQSVSGAITGQALTLVLADRETVSAEAIAIDGRLLLDLTSGKGRGLRAAQGQAVVRDYRSATLRLREGAFSMTAADAANPWRLALTGDYYGPLDIKARGDYLAAETTRLTVAELGGALAGRSLALAHATTLTWDDDGWRLAATELALGEGRAAAAAERTARSATAHIDLKDADLAVLSLLAGRTPLAGQVSGTLDLTIAPDQAAGAAAIEARQVGEAFDDGLSPRFDLALTSQFRGTGDILAMETTASLSGADIAARLSLRLPVAVRHDGRPTLALVNDAPLAGALSWNGPLSPLILLTNLSEDVFEGALDADIAIAGTLRTPALNGALRVRDGRYENLRWGAALQNVAAAATLDGQTLRVTELTAQDGNGGKASAAGTLTLKGYSDVVGRLTASLQKLRLLRIGSVTASASGQLAYDRTADDAALTGALDIDGAEISLAKKLPPEIVVLEVREINSPTSMALAANGGDRALPTFRRLDLALSADRRVWLRGRGLDSEWQGALRVRGDAAAPTIDGALKAVRGTFEFAGKTFTLSDGGLRFTGGRAIDPAIDLRAEYATFDFKAILTLSGTLSRPTVELTSDPPLPQDEVMARILFGAGVQSLTALEAVQLASAVSSLSSGGGWDVFSVARKALSLDRLAVGASEDRSAGAQVTGGKYLTDRVYLEVRTDTETGASDATLRVDVTRNLQVESDVGGQTGGNRLGLRWKKDY